MNSIQSEMKFLCKSEGFGHHIPRFSPFPRHIAHVAHGMVCVSVKIGSPSASRGSFKLNARPGTSRGASRNPRRARLPATRASVFSAIFRSINELLSYC